MKLTALDVTLEIVEVLGNGLNAARVADEDYLVGQLFRTNVQMKYASVFVNNQFLRCKVFAHSYSVIWF